MMKKVALTLAACASAEEIKIGMLLKDSGTDLLGKRAAELWKTWADGQADTLGWTVTFDEKVYSADTMADDVAALAGANHVLVSPYTSGLTKSFVDAVPDSFTGPILAWGGASDSIFTTNCANKHCFGTFSVASHYMVGALTAILAKSDGDHDMKVGLVENDNAFSAGVCAGARDFISKTHGLSAIDASNVQVTKGALTDDDKTAITTLMTQKPDILLVCGHSGGDVEDVVMTVFAGSERPTAIIATNSITPAAQARFTDAGHAEALNCLIMPTQWGESESTDPNVGWDSAAFKSAFGTDFSYHAASMAGALIALTQALVSGDAATRADELATLMQAVDITSFYGPLSFNADGSIKKPMYFQQHQGTAMPIFTQMYGELMGDLHKCPSWGNPSTCGDVKTLYKSNSCCGNPAQAVDVKSLMR